MDHQDWNSVSWTRTPKAEVSKKPKVKLTPQDGDDPEAPKVISNGIRVLIQKGRVAQGLSQKQLAKDLNIPVNTINKYEAGSAIPDMQVLRRLSQKLGIKL